MCPGQWWKVEKCTAKHVLYYSVVHAKGLELLLLYFLLGLDPLVTCAFCGSTRGVIRRSQYDGEELDVTNLSLSKSFSEGLVFAELQQKRKARRRKSCSLSYAL
ncbi:hypothetical protein SCA6_004788 [Theobroma cacao]